MNNKTFARFVFSLVLVFSFFNVSLPQIGYAQAAASQTQAASDLQSRLAAIERKTDARRKELGIPGMSLAIVKDGEVIFAKGFGYKDFAKQIPVTPDTQFAIGSATKAFTALSVLMSQEEGKLNLDDSPKKYLPFFKINNPETDKNITIRDLLSHSSGLNRTDLAMITGKLTREELIKVAGEAKPTAGLREKFQYQNIMFAAAGEIVAKVQNQAWEKFVPEKIFKPLGMTNSTMSIREMKKARDYSLGYDYNFDTKETRNLPFKEIDEVAPAGSINSSANDMARWLKFMLSGGEAGGRRLVSASLFAELVKPQMKITPNGKVSYGLGWFLQEWKGLKVVQHGGNIDGFNSLAAMIPEKNLGFVMLTNVSGSSLGGELMPLIWEGILGKPSSEDKSKVVAAANTATTNPDRLPLEKLVGKYYFKETGFIAEIALKDGKLLMIVPAQPEYTLEAVEGNKYKMSPLPSGFFVTFRPSPAKPDEIELISEQPNTSFTMSRATDADLAVVSKKIEGYRELVGDYQSKDNAESKAKFAVADTALTVQLTGQPPLALIEKSTDIFGINGFPASYQVKVKRDADKKITAVIFSQPEGEFEYTRISAPVSSAPKLSVEELMAKTIDALGGEANWRKISSREMKFDLDFEQQGVKGYGTSRSKAPNLFATESTFTALGKPIATTFEYFDGATGGDQTSFSPFDTYSGQRLENLKLNSDFYGLVNWRNNLKSSEITGMDKVNGEDAYVLVFHPEKASDVTYFISAKSFLPVKKTSVIVSSTSSVKLPYSEFFSDYRAVDGLMLPFKTVSVSPSMGDIVTYIKEIKHNVSIEDKMFKPKK